MINSFATHEMEDSEGLNPANSRSKPKSVLIYNGSMGAVDDVDKTIRPLQALLKTRRWYKKFAFHLNDLAIFNTFVVYRYLNGTAAAKTYKDFLISLVREILRVNKKPEGNKRGRPSSSAKPKDARLLNVGLHLPKKIVDENGRAKLSDCHFCRMEGRRHVTSIKCETCDKRLCLEEFESGNSCFKKFHTLPNLPQPKRVRCLKLIIIM